MSQNDEMDMEDAMMKLAQKETSRVSTTTRRADRESLRESNDEDDNDLLFTIVTSVLALVILIPVMVIFTFMAFHAAWSRQTVTIGEAMASLAVIIMTSGIAWWAVTTFPYLALSSLMKWWKNCHQQRIGSQNAPPEDHHHVQSGNSSSTRIPPALVIISPCDLRPLVPPTTFAQGVTGSNKTGSRWLVFLPLVSLPFVEAILLEADALGFLNLGGLGSLAFSSPEWYLAIGVLIGAINATLPILDTITEIRHSHLGK